MNTRSIKLANATLEIRGLYWGELDESAQATLADALSALPEGVSLKDIRDLVPDTKLETDVDVAVAKAEAKLAKYGGLHMGTLLRCGIVAMRIDDGDDSTYLRGVEDSERIAEAVAQLSPREADLVAQAVFDLTDMPEDEVENLGSG